jgi:hypothetical protein
MIILKHYAAIYDFINDLIKEFFTGILFNIKFKEE